MQIGIVPSDLGRSLEFYRVVLGLVPKGTIPVADGRVLHLFEADGATLKLIELAPGDREPVAAARGSFVAATGLRWLTLDVDDLDLVAGRVERSGARWQLPVVEYRPGLRVAIVEDPDGNAIELVERK
jgi:catechol 2,3-dioxygenase-like lactoylglutathione lyase family enzyme